MTAPVDTTAQPDALASVLENLRGGVRAGNWSKVSNVGAQAVLGEIERLRSALTAGERRIAALEDTLRWSDAALCDSLNFLRPTNLYRDVDAMERNIEKCRDINRKVLAREPQAVTFHGDSQ